MQSKCKGKNWTKLLQKTLKYSINIITNINTIYKGESYEKVKESRKNIIIVNCYNVNLCNINTYKKDNQNTNTNEPATNTNTNNNINTNKESSLPKTGANDTAMWVVIGTCVVLAIYAYKKVRDYNV